MRLSTGSRLLVLLASWLFVAFPTRALDLQLRGFADLIGTQTNSRLALSTINNGAHLTLDSETRIGLNLSSDLGNNLSFAGQLLAQGNDSGQYSLNALWIFANYKPIEGLTLRFGRQINPIFLYSEQFDVGFTYIWTRLPAVVYGILPVNAFSGLSVIYSYFINRLQLRTQIYGGAGDTDVETATASIKSSANDLMGFETTLSADHFKVRLGYTSYHPSGKMTLISGGAPIPLTFGHYKMASAGVQFDYSKFLISTEYAHSESESPLIHTGAGGYASVAYRVLPRLTPYLTFGREGNLSGSLYQFPDSTVSTTQLIQEDNYIAGINFKLTPSAIVKLEYMRVENRYIDSSKNFGADVATGALSVIF